MCRETCTLPSSRPPWYSGVLKPLHLNHQHNGKQVCDQGSNRGSHRRITAQVPVEQKRRMGGVRSFQRWHQDNVLHPSRESSSGRKCCAHKPGKSGAYRALRKAPSGAFFFVFIVVCVLELELNVFRINCYVNH